MLEITTYFEHDFCYKIVKMFALIGHQKNVYKLTNMGMVSIYFIYITLTCCIWINMEWLLVLKTMDFAVLMELCFYLFISRLKTKSTFESKYTLKKHADWTFDSSQ